MSRTRVTNSSSLIGTKPCIHFTWVIWGTSQCRYPHSASLSATQNNFIMTIPCLNYFQAQIIIAIGFVGRRIDNLSLKYNISQFVCNNFAGPVHHLPGYAFDSDWGSRVVPGSHGCCPSAQHHSIQASVYLLLETHSRDSTMSHCASGGAK